MIRNRLLYGPGLVGSRFGPLRSNTPLGLCRNAVQKRHESSSESGDNNSGHITTTQSEGVLFFTNLLPVNARWLFRIPWSLEKAFPNALDRDRVSSISATNIQSVLRKATDNSALAGKVSVVEILPRLKEGAAFLKFNHDQSISSADVATAVIQHLKANKISPWWDPFGAVRVELVKGKPWVEDLYRLPSRRIKVEFLPKDPGGEVAELTQEQLYSYFRPYGKLADILPQSSESKIVPRHAHLDFLHLRRAIMAKNCLHGLVVGPEEGGGKLGTVFRLTYEKKQRFGWIKDWIFGHTRIVIPILAALIAGLTVAVFDPIRTLSIKAHITRAFHVEDNVLVRWFIRQSRGVLDQLRKFGHTAESMGGMKVVWEDRQAEVQQIQAWLMETADTFIVVQGPRGSGKKELVVDYALQHKREAHRVLVIDCKPVQEARGDTSTIAATAAQVGYRPVFSWMNSISGMIDLAAQGTAGVKTGFSETLENQLVKIFNNTAAALKSIALDGRSRNEKDASMSDDEYLEAHPERRPVVVIDNFLHKSNEAGAAMVYDKLAEWAARVTTTNCAHVIFLTTDVSFTKSLSKALPDRTFRQISLGDCSPDIARRYVINHLDFDAEETSKMLSDDGDAEKRLTPSQKREDLRELPEVIDLLGGRLTDLEFLARRIKSGETPKKAVDEIIAQSASEVMKMFLFTGVGADQDRQWTPQQAWTLIRSLSEKDTLRFNEILFTDAFKSGGEKALAALEQAELISVHSENGRPHGIRPGRPVYYSAFRRLVDDNVLAARMNMAIITDSISTENGTIAKMEQELELLGKLPKQPGELANRITWLLSKIKGSQDRIERFEKESAKLKKVLQSEY